jgi:hypothetical protein
MSSLKNDMAMANAMLEQLPREWLSTMTGNMLIVYSSQMVGQRGYAKTVDYLRDMADVIEKCGMDLDGRKTWK